MLAAWALHSMAAAEPISILVAVPGGKPVVEEPGVRPRKPSITVGPELVTVWAAQTPNLTVVAPRESCAKVDVGMRRRRAASMRNVGGNPDIADQKGYVGWLMRRVFDKFQEV